MLGPRAAVAAAASAMMPKVAAAVLLSALATPVWAGSGGAMTCGNSYDVIYVIYGFIQFSSPVGLLCVQADRHASAATLSVSHGVLARLD